MTYAEGGRRKAEGGARAERVELPRRVAILGFARSGQALARALLDRGVEVSVGDAKPESAFPDAEKWRREGARVLLGGPGPGFLEGVGWLAISPGVPLTTTTVLEARNQGVPVFSELEIAWRIAESEAKGRNHWVAVTGTNGKSTTTAWIADILQRAGRKVALAGNIGVPLSSFLSDRSVRDYVCEVSSFQLETIDRFRSDVAVLTNITPDHLDRYEDFEQYRRAKQRLFENQTLKDFAIVNADDPASKAILLKARRFPFSRSGGERCGTWSEEGWLFSATSGGVRRVMPVRGLGLSGAHNLENALAALAAADCLGISEKAILEGLESFRGLPHRTELVADAGGVAWVDDSKGTNVDATKKSLESFRQGSVLLILGGRDKHGDFSALRDAVSRAARHVLTIGEAAGKIEEALSDVVPIQRAGDMVRAVERARELARPGETVLLSPACASFDQYNNFEERGDHFARLARQAAEGERRKAKGEKQ